MTVKDRLKEFIKYKGIPVRKFEDIIGVSHSYVSNIRVSIQPDKMQSIAKYYPELNTAWLLTGEGSMLKDASDISISGSYNNIGQGNNAGDNIVSDSTIRYANNQNEIKFLKLEIESLKRQLEDKDSIIATKDQLIKLYETMINK